MIPNHDFEKDGVIIQECDYCAANCSVGEPQHNANCAGVKIEKLEISLLAEKLNGDRLAKDLKTIGDNSNDRVLMAVINIALKAHSKLRGK